MRRNLLGITLFVLALALVATSLRAPGTPPSSAAGTVSIAADVPITLYGSAESGGNGWGHTSADISQPGPTIRVNQSDTITFSLFATDSTSHILVLDFDRDGTQDTDDRASPQFSSPSTAVTFTWVADRAGTFQYYCGVHGATLQSGTLVVNSTESPSPAGDSTLLIVGGVIVVVVIVSAAAMIMRRKPKPPVEPPTQ